MKNQQKSFIESNKELALLNNIKNDKISIYLEVDFYGEKVHALIDTGAQSTLISDKLIKEKNLEYFIDKDAKIKMNGFTSNTICKKIHFMKIKIFEDEYMVNFYVFEKCINKIVLGMNFLIRYNAGIDIKNHKIKLNDKEYPLIFEY
jgi:DNA damage-inducible protein 1